LYIYNTLWLAARAITKKQTKPNQITPVFLYESFLFFHSSFFSSTKQEPNKQSLLSCQSLFSSFLLQFFSFFFSFLFSSHFSFSFYFVFLSLSLSVSVCVGVCVCLSVFLCLSLSLSLWPSLSISLSPSMYVCACLYLSCPPSPLF